MIQKLRRKLVVMMMAVVAFILLAIFFTMLFATRQNSERMSLGTLRQALNPRTFSGGQSPFSGSPLPGQGPNAQMRMPVLIAAVGRGGEITLLSNQLHFISEQDVAAICLAAMGQEEPTGVLSAYTLRYLREDGESGVRIAFIDISMEQEILKTQVFNSLLIGAIAMAAFFVLSLLLARWAVGPVETAWTQQKQFIANASHELKTPLTVIVSNADMLRGKGGLEGDKNIRRMEHIHAEALRMKQLVEDMLTLARSDSGQMTEACQPLDLSYLIKSAALMYEPMIYDEGKRLIDDIDDDLWVAGDGSRLQQMIHILLDNALKYSAPHSTIHLGLHKAEHRSLLLQVTNQGESIPREALKKIFSRFYRLEEARSRHGSFGLGLSIAQSIVQNHQGRIWADSDGKSSNTFYVLLPLAEPGPDHKAL